MSVETSAAIAAPVAEPKRLAFFERYLTVWVLVCMVVGVAFGKLLPDLTATLSKLEFGQGSQVNVPIGVLLWLMIYPMMLKVDFSAIGGIAQTAKGIAGDAVCELAGEAVQHGAAGLDLHAARLCRLDWPGDGQAIHRRTHHPGRGALHGDGVCLVATSPTATRPTRWCRWR